MSLSGGLADGEEATEFWYIIQGQGGLGSGSGRPFDGGVGLEIWHPYQPGDGLEKLLLSGAPELFADGRSRQAESSVDEQELYEQIGRLKMEVEWLKNLPNSTEELRLFTIPSSWMMQPSERGFNCVTASLGYLLE